ncbi:nuclear transport factor 2 family protein [Streptacidiphilus jiangxiensis]|uniref:SnoaL-like domain-containing protein n=1 Tax=Streptacidiphilus jiangxiensis TaxID=235985 RepID=A0A1H7KV07_STRJI|nr:nuclear transport factor 2 family protein [Streptacidiphilus jiangxiensis]SEK90651.1 hypothetical protein SAMN05414137_104217 [Streptacidiphilus jiangxiensis]
MNATATETAIREHLRAFNDRDLPALLAGFTDDAVWITGRSVARGRTELTELFTGALEHLLPTLTLENLLVDGDRAACQMVEHFTVSGHRREAPVAGFYHLRDGRISSAKIYREGSAEVDAAEAAEAVEAAGNDEFTAG